MKKMWFVLGGARSGKSTFALNLAKKNAGKVLFVATATPSDEFMEERIRRHRQERPVDWTTLEVTRDVGKAIKSLPQKYDVIIIDCLTVLAGSRIIELPENVGETQAWEALRPEVEGIIDAWENLESTFIIVGNEVGLGVVPATNIGCTYRDALGRANCELARNATDVVVMVAGLPMILKHSN
ncbi:MAG: bifunctional adenosylcobinamide kinase/adenosylcobinamide-phosphate guanylyltransferase [Caldisericia bacterium]|nr:bifunctional adenosylcobinamide kinase/adenosylcobinamide-phosphate guanylyltransferase [Caldisericia bacterium]